MVISVILPTIEPPPPFHVIQRKGGPKSKTESHHRNKKNQKFISNTCRLRRYSATFTFIVCFNKKNILKKTKQINDVMVSSVFHTTKPVFFCFTMTRPRQTWSSPAANILPNIFMVVTTTVNVSERSAYVTL